MGGSPCDAGLHFEGTMTPLACAGWLGGRRALPRGVAYWHWRRSMTPAPARRRPASAGSACRRSGSAATLALSHGNHESFLETWKSGGFQGVGGGGASPVQTGLPPYFSLHEGKNREKASAPLGHSVKFPFGL